MSVTFVLVLCAFWGTAHSYIYPNKGLVLPNDPYVYIGNNLTLTCNLTQFDAVYDSTRLFFSRRNDEVIPTKYVTIINSRSVLLQFPIKSPEDGGHYICKLNRTRIELIGSQIVMVEYEPKPVTQIDCRVYNWENMTCTWDLGVTFLHSRTMDITLVWTTLGPQWECKHQTMTSCSWLAVDGRDSFVMDVVYTMTVTIINNKTKPKPTIYPNQAFERKTSELVEPAPVSNLKAEANSTCITLSWTHGKVRRDKIYRVQYRSEKDRVWKTRDNGDMESMVLCDLLPHVHYEFNVSCKPRLYNQEVKGFWSKGATIAVLTSEDVPSAAPEISVGSYMESPCQDICKQLTLYWKPLDMKEANGNITYYRIDYRNLDSGSDWDTISATRTQQLLLLVPTDSYLIQLRAATKKGVSNHYTEILVPPFNKKPKVPEHVVTAHNLSQETAITVAWSPPPVVNSSAWKRLTSYTVYWCRGYKLERRCQEPIQSQEVELSQREIILLVNMFEIHMFGVAVNAELWTGERVSSGFRWNICTYAKYTKPDVAPVNVRLAVHQPDNGLTLEWDRLTCGDTRAYIQEYIIYMCPARRGDNCSGEIVKFAVPSTENSFTIEDLKEGNKYKLWMSAMSEKGQGPECDVLYGAVINRSLKPGEISGIVIASLFVLIIFLFGFILCFRRVFRTVKQKYFVPVPIEIPHTLPPLPPIPMPPRQLTPDSDSSDGIYEKIDGPPSPSSSTESTTGVEAPLIQSKWKLSTLKNQIYSKKKDQKQYNDSGRGSMSHSADTLLMRLHPSHFKRNKKPKKTNKSESDSGVIVDGRGQVSSYYSGKPCHCSSNGISSQNMYDFGGVNPKPDRTGEVNPYSCVDIVEKMNSERLNRKVTENSLDIENPVQDKYKGSTLSLPPGFYKPGDPLSQPLCLKAKSTGNELDIEDNKLCSMVEAKEFESSDIYSEDGTLDSVGDNEHETSESFNSQELVDSSVNSSGGSGPPINSYMKFRKGAPMEINDEVFLQDQPLNSVACDCACHREAQGEMSDGYVMATHNPENCSCEMIKMNGHMPNSETLLEVPQRKNKPRPNSFVHNLPPHFFSSLSSVPIDPATTTEL